MTEIEQKVATVVRYINKKKSVNIGNINLKTGLDLQKLNYAYNIAIKYYMKNGKI